LQTQEYVTRLEIAANYVKNCFNAVPDVAVVLGSGLNNFAEELENKQVIWIIIIISFVLVFEYLANNVNAT
jgi:hypothetical protein